MGVSAATACEDGNPACGVASPPSKSRTAYCQPSPNNGRKRKATASSATEVSTEVTPTKQRTKPSADSPEIVKEEKRFRRWRAKAPLSYHEVRDRALTQRMFVLDRQRATVNDDSNPQSSSEPYPVEKVALAGTTGNIYEIRIDKLPTCDCPHARKGNQCKHIVYVLTRVLRVASHLEYQLAFTSHELRQIFAEAPALPSETAKSNDDKDGKRKPLDGGCPICCEDFEDGEDSKEQITYCKASCGNNLHKACFEQWAATCRSGKVTCPYCRSEWQGDSDVLKKLVRTGEKNQEGYVNVASQLGISGRRDYSSYHSFWVRRQAREGLIDLSEDGVMDHAHGYYE